MKAFITAAFIAHLITGSLCTMPMANAEPAEKAVPNTSSMHHDCDHCPHDERQSAKKLPCGSGHCLSADQPETSVSSRMGTEIRAPAVLDIVLATLPEPILDQPSWKFIAEGPPSETGVGTIVLRQ